MQIGAAEGVLGAVAVVLIVWLLWPEDQSPQIDQRVAWQQTVEETERRRALADARPAIDEQEKNGGDAAIAPRATVERAERPIEPERRRIARPSELADRLDSFALNRAFQPGARRPAVEGANLTESVDETGAAEGSSVETALAEMVDHLKTDPTTAGDGSVAISRDDGFDPDDPSLDIAVVSSEALDAQSLAEIDLSDLDSLVAPDATDAKPAPRPDDLAVAAVEPTLSIDDRLSREKEAVEPFVVDRDPDTPSGGVRQRPRDDAPSWLKNAVTAAAADERPIIAVVIDDLGLNRRNTAALNDLPSPLTLAFLPYAGRIAEQTGAAQAAGHELMLHMPMEPFGTDWPGPDALTTKIDQDEFTKRLLKNLNRFDGFVGINNHMGSRLTADSSRMQVVMQELRKRDVLFLDSKTSARSVAGDVAAQAGVPNTTRDVFLDHVIAIDSIKRQLALTESVARRTGSAVAIGHPHGTTIAALREWLPTMESRGFVLAPISAVVARRACNSGVLIAAETCGRYLQARKPAEAALAAKDG